MRMEAEPGKLFVGGISWDTNEDRLRDYFQSFGEVVEAVIMKDRTTGRARGFGFVVFADPAAADRVVKEKHIIDGRTVEAKKAVPRDDQHTVNRNTSSAHSSPGPVRTKKIFVGGLASNVTESDFKTYFDQFGLITDVVVMYDHNTQRPRGFGFITYDSEEAVDKVLTKTFHELNGKMVEVKRAVPKELSPGPTRSPLGGGYNYGLNRVSNILNAYSQGYNPNSMGGYGVRMDGRFSPVTVGRSGYPPFSPSNYSMGPMLDSALGSNYGGTGNFGSNLGFGRGLNPFYGNSNRFGTQMAYGIGGSGSGTGPTLNSPGRNSWGNGNFGYNTNSSNSYDFVGSGGANTGSLGAFGGTGGIWGSSSISGQGGVNVSPRGGNMIYSGGENSIASGRGHGRNSGSSMGITLNDVHDGALGNLYGGGGSSFYGDSTWRSLSPEIEGSGSFSYGLGNAVSDVAPNNSMGFDGGHNITSRTNRGIPAYEDHYTVTTKLL